MTYKQMIQNMKNQYIGKKVRFQGAVYTIVDVDYNGALLIDKKAQYTNTTAVGTYHVKFIEE